MSSDELAALSIGAICPDCENRGARVTPDGGHEPCEWCYHHTGSVFQIRELIADIRRQEHNNGVEEACEVLRKHGLATGHGESVTDVVEQAIWQAKERESIAIEALCNNAGERIVHTSHRDGIGMGSQCCEREVKTIIKEIQSRRKPPNPNGMTGD